MSREEITVKLKEAYKIVNEEEAPDSFCESTNLRTDIGMSSIGMLYFVIVLESLFSVRFEGVGVEDFVTVGDVINFIEKNIKV